MERIVAELGGGSVEGRMSVLSVAADGADAVIYGQDGGELIRLPGVDASGILPMPVRTVPLSPSTVRTAIRRSFIVFEKPEQ